MSWSSMIETAVGMIMNKVVGNKTTVPAKSELELEPKEERNKTPEPAVGMITMVPYSFLNIKADPAVEADPAVAMITKERVPDSFINRIKMCLSRKLPPLSEGEIELYTELCSGSNRLVESEQAHVTLWNYFVDLQQDCLRQHAEKGYAEVGIDYSKGIKQMFILPQPAADDH